MDRKKKTSTGGMATVNKQGPSFFKKLFRWSSSRSSSMVDQEKPSLQPSPLMKRSKSDKDVLLATKPAFVDGKSATLPNPRHSEKSNTFSPRRSVRAPAQSRSPVKRQPGHHPHSPITIGTSVSPPTPRSSRRHRFPPSQLPKQTAASFWDISPMAAAEAEHKKKQLVRSNSIGNSSSHHDYSEPYHWLFAPQYETSFVPPLPPRPPHIQPGFRKYMNVGEMSSVSLCDLNSDPKSHDYMSISALTLNPRPDASDYQQPIVSQRTPLPSCIRHRKMDQTLHEIDPTANERTKLEEEEEEEHSPSAYSRNRGDKRITVVILNDDRTLKV